MTPHDLQQIRTDAEVSAVLSLQHDERLAQPEALRAVPMDRESAA